MAGEAPTPEWNALPPGWESAIKEWTYWRGSPELLAHVARAAIRTVEEGSTSATCTIAVTVGYDQEVFASPSDFTSQVTPEALRKFTATSIFVAGDARAAMFIASWETLPDGDKQAEVWLRVAATSQAALADTFNTVQAAIQRGTSGRTRRQQRLIGSALTALITAPLVAAVVSAVYLLNGSLKAGAASGAAGAAIGLAFLLAQLSTKWIYPALEIAPPGRNNVTRLIRFVGPPVVAFVLAGLGKLAYG
ncbi:MAG TPA: hypothetical protein VHY83_04925 [Solirubrobacteraceae bacterium]|jgi:hypothetical protein|nr:hypothetical protein [Solirubrobacteraceae bacterium]